MISGIVIGRVVRDPRAFKTQKGGECASVCVLSEQHFGDRVTQTYIDAVAFFKSVVSDVMRCKQGDLVGIQFEEVRGEVYTPTNGGDPKAKVKVTAKAFNFFDTPNAPTPQPKPQHTTGPRQQKEPPVQPDPTVPTNGVDEDVPF